MCKQKTHNIINQVMEEDDAVFSIHIVKQAIKEFFNLPVSLQAATADEIRNSGTTGIKGNIC